VTSPLVLLDLDGTLMDSGPGITLSVVRAYEILGLAVPDATALRSFIGPPIPTSFAAHGVPAARIDEAVLAYRGESVTRMISHNGVYDGIAEVLTELRAAGLRLVVATSKPAIYAHPICDWFGLTDRVDAVFGAPDDEATSTKAAVIAEALAAFPVTESGVLMVGDREHDVLGARAHGVDTVGVTWGYAAPGELTAAGAVELVSSPAALTAAILRRLVTRGA